MIDLAITTLKAMGPNKGIEESWYWRAMAELASGDQTAAIEDFRESLVWHQGFIPSVEQLNTSRVNPLGENGN